MSTYEFPLEVVEASAMRLYLADYETGRERSWDETDADIREAYRQTVRAVLAPAAWLVVSLQNEREWIAGEIWDETKAMLAANADLSGPYLAGINDMGGLANRIASSGARADAE